MTPAGQGFDVATLWLIAGWAAIVAGGLLLLWALFRDRSRGRRRCPKCWYDMKGVPGLRCPECGREARNEKRFFKTRRRYGFALIAAAFLLVGAIGTRVPKALKYGWLDAVPVLLLKPAFWWERERARDLYTNEVLRSARRYSGTPFSGGNPNFLPAGGPPIVTVPTQWERLLVASEAARRIDSAGPQPGPSPAEAAKQKQTGQLVVLELKRIVEELAAGEIEFDGLEPVRVAGDLGRESRPAHAALRRSLHASPTPTLVNVAASLSQTGDADFSSDLRLLLDRHAEPRIHSAALSGLIGIEMRSGPLSWAVKAAILREPCDNRLFHGWVRQVPATGKPTSTMLDLVATMLKHRDKKARTIATIPVLFWMAERHWSEDFAQELWSGQGDEDVLCLLAYMIGRCGGNEATWGPRLMQLAEHPSPAVRLEAMNGLYHRTLSKEWTPSTCTRWLAALDASRPLENGERRQPWAWIAGNIGGSRRLEPVVVNAVAAAVGATSEDVIAMLVPIMLDGEQPRIRRAAIVGLSEQRIDIDRAYAFALRVLAAEPDAYVRATAFDSLVRPHLSDARMRQMLNEGLMESDPIVLIIVAQIAGTVHDPSPLLVARLRQLAESADYIVANISRGSLRHLGLETEMTAIDSPPLPASPPLPSTPR